MRTRKEVLRDLISINGNIEELKNELSCFSWDADQPIAIITVNDFLVVITKVISEEISFELLVEWANLIECRDDIDFEKEELQELIFELANPEINGAVTRERLNEIEKELG